MSRIIFMKITRHGLAVEIQMKTTTGQAIAGLRDDLGLTQRALAEKLGVTVTTVARWEADQRQPDKYKLIDMVLMSKRNALRSFFETKVGRTWEEIVGNYLTGSERKDEEAPEATQYWRVASKAISSLYDLASAGHVEALQRLHIISEYASQLVSFGADNALNKDSLAKQSRQPGRGAFVAGAKFAIPKPKR